MSGADVVLDKVHFAYGDMPMAFDLAVAAGSYGHALAAHRLLSRYPDAGILQRRTERLLEAVERTRLSEPLTPAERPVSMIFQEHNLFAHLDAATNVALGLSPSGRLGTEERKQVDEALAQVGLSGFGKRLPGELSGGERQRVALARVLVRDKPVLLLDEPFAALGPALRREALGLVRELQRRHGMTVLMVTHLPEDARAAASHVAFLKAGRIAAYGPAAEVLGAGASADVRAYTGEG